MGRRINSDRNNSIESVVTSHGNEKDLNSKCVEEERRTSHLCVGSGIPPGWTWSMSWGSRHGSYLPSSCSYTHIPTTPSTSDGYVVQRRGFPHPEGFMTPLRDGYVTIGCRTVGTYDPITLSPLLYSRKNEEPHICTSSLMKTPRDPKYGNENVRRLGSVTVWVIPVLASTHVRYLG